MEQGAGKRRGSRQPASGQLAEHKREQREAPMRAPAAGCRSAAARRTAKKL